MDILKNLRKNKDLRLSNERIKDILQTSRLSLGQIIDRTGDRNARQEMQKICEDLYDVNESISSDELAKIEEPTKDTLIATTKKIEEITKKVEIFDPRSKSVVTTIVAKTLKIRECFLSQKASA